MAFDDSLHGRQSNARSIVLVRPEAVERTEELNRMLRGGAWEIFSDMDNGNQQRRQPAAGTGSGSGSADRLRRFLCTCPV